MSLPDDAVRYIESHFDETFELFKALSGIPAPSGQEEARAEFCLKWLYENGVGQAYVDDAKNVVIPFGNCGKGAHITAFLAHSDVVFPNTDPLPQRIEGDRFYVPGGGDNTIHVVHMLMAARYITHAGIKPSGAGVLLVIDSGEEGLGNLLGCRKVMEDFATGMEAMYAFDGRAGTVFNGSIGSKRYKVEVKTEGGHSYSDFGNRNAIVYLASMINTLCQIQLPDDDKVTYNVGTISGGTSVNSIAEQAEMLYEFRSPKRNLLDMMDRHFLAVIESYRTKGIEVDVKTVGERPCAAEVDEQRQAALAQKAAEATRRYFDVEMRLVSGSTDCNVPLSMGIPSVGVGCYQGGGAHTLGEYILISSILPGQKVVFELILGCFNQDGYWYDADVGVK